MRKAILTIKTNENTEEATTLTVEAECEEFGGVLKVYYEEALLFDQTVNTCVTIDTDCVYVERDGAIGADLYFCKNTSYETDYSAGGGLKMKMQIVTQKLNIKRSETGASVYAEYQLSLTNIKINDTTISMQVQYL